MNCSWQRERFWQKRPWRLCLAGPVLNLDCMVEVYGIGDLARLHEEFCARLDKLTALETWCSSSTMVGALFTEFVSIVFGWECSMVKESTASQGVQGFY